MHAIRQLACKYCEEADLLHQAGLHIVRVEMEVHAAGHLVVDPTVQCGSVCGAVCGVPAVADHAVPVDPERGGRGLQAGPPQLHRLVHKHLNTQQSRVQVWLGLCLLNQSFFWLYLRQHKPLCEGTTIFSLK